MRSHMHNSNGSGRGRVGRSLYSNDRILLLVTLVAQGRFIRVAILVQ